jgi:perosamine synthetase
MTDELALYGGLPILQHTPNNYNPYGEEEIQAATDVIKSGCLSSFIGAWGEGFLGGPQVQAFEAEWAAWFGVKHAICVNSLTSGLVCAIGALDIEPGDEVIVSPWTMSASATCILIWNAIPVFADILPDTFNLDPDAVAKKITPRTKAIVVPSIFGYGADFIALKGLADKHGIKIIEDAAQSPGVLYEGRYLGTWGDIGGFSLNYHKHIHTGEGGVCVTNDDNLADRMRLIRNHAEAVVDKKGQENINNMLGFNFRLGEIEAALGRCQLKKLSQKVALRFSLGQALQRQLADLPGLYTTPVKAGNTHAYYVFGMRLDTQKIGISRDKLFSALVAEGVPSLSKAYVNVHRYAMYRHKIAYGTGHFPWKNGLYESPVTYGSGTCPVAEQLQDHEYLGFNICQYDWTLDDMTLIAEAFKKVWRHRDLLK